MLHCRLLHLLVTIICVVAQVNQEDVPPEPQPPDAPRVAEPSIQPAFQHPNRERRELPAEGVEFIRSMALLLLPPKFDDENGWGDEKRIPSGLNVDFDDGRIKTSRRWKMVNHGSWLKGSGELVDPENTFVLRTTQLPDPEIDTRRYEVQLAASLHVHGRQQQWNYGVMLWSVSAEASVNFSLQTTLDVKSEILTTEKGTRLRFIPRVIHAAAKLDNFRLHRISHVKGTVVQGIGELTEELLQLRIKKENKDLADRINKALQKQADSLEIPLDIAGWFGVSPKDSAQPQPESDPAPVSPNKTDESPAK